MTQRIALIHAVQVAVAPVAAAFARLWPERTAPHPVMTSPASAVAKLKSPLA
jgi:hypothetical protein